MKAIKHGELSFSYSEALEFCAAKRKQYALYRKCLDILEELIASEKPVKTNILAAKAGVPADNISSLKKDYPEFASIVTRYTQFTKNVELERLVVLVNADSVSIVPADIAVDFHKASLALGYYPGFVAFLNEIKGPESETCKRTVHKKRSWLEGKPITVGKDLLLAALRVR